MKYNFSVHLTEKDLYSFMMYHNYHGAQGKLGILVGILGFVAAIATFGKVETIYTILYVACGIIFLVFSPISLKMRSKRQFLLVPEMKEEMRYELSDEGIKTALKDQEANFMWINLFKVVGTNDYIYLYSDRMHASILPKREMGDQYDAIVELIKLKAPQGKVKIK